MIPGPAQEGTSEEVLGSPFAVVHGGARGADTYAGEWADEREGIVVEVYPADWNTHGKAAGPIRNRQVAETRPDFAVFFGKGTGTKDAIGLCYQLQIPYRWYP